VNRRHEHTAGFSLPEALVAVALLGLLASLGTVGTQRQLARMRVEAAIRRVASGIEAGRAAALRRGRPCGLTLSEEGWETLAGGELIGCAEAARSLSEGVAAGEVQLSHTLPEEVRFSANGLVLDGGTVVVAAPGTELRRCLVMALPLGVVRLGRYGGEGGGEGGGAPSAEACQPDPAQ